MGTEDDPVEECSGYLVDRQERHIYFYLGWDVVMRKPTMIRWDPVEPDDRMRRAIEYLEARQDLGLPPRYERWRGRV